MCLYLDKAIKALTWFWWALNIHNDINPIGIEGIEDLNCLLIVIIN